MDRGMCDARVHRPAPRAHQEAETCPDEEPLAGDIVRREGDLPCPLILTGSHTHELIEEGCADASSAGVRMDIDRQAPPGRVQPVLPHRADTDQIVVCFDNQRAAIPTRFIDCWTVDARPGEFCGGVVEDGGK